MTYILVYTLYNQAAEDAETARIAEEQIVLLQNTQAIVLQVKLPKYKL